MVERWGLLAALLSLALLAPAGADTPPDTKDWPVTLQRARAEAPLLRKTSVAVRRDGLSLRLRSSSGKTVAFDSLHPGPETEAQYTDFRYAGT